MCIFCVVDVYGDIYFINMVVKFMGEEIKKVIDGKDFVKVFGNSVLGLEKDIID